MLKYLKLGFGKVTDNVNEKIRQGSMTREEGLKIVRQFDGQCERRNILEFCQYIDITEQEFWNVVDGFVNKDLFVKGEAGLWQPRFEVV